MKEILSSLIKLADHLDKQGFHAEADQADAIVKKITAATVCEKCKAVECKCEPVEEEKLVPTKTEEACMAEANLQKVQMRRRARRRRLMTKQG